MLTVDPLSVSSLPPHPNTHTHRSLQRPPGPQGHKTFPTWSSSPSSSPHWTPNRWPCEIAACGAHRIAAELTESPRSSPGADALVVVGVCGECERDAAGTGQRGRHSEPLRVLRWLHCQSPVVAPDANHGCGDRTRYSAPEPVTECQLRQRRHRRHRASPGVTGRHWASPTVTRRHRQSPGVTGRTPLSPVSLGDGERRGTAGGAGPVRRRPATSAAMVTDCGSPRAAGGTPGLAVPRAAWSPDSGASRGRDSTATARRREVYTVFAGPGD